MILIERVSLFNCPFTFECFVWSSPDSLPPWCRPRACLPGHSRSPRRWCPAVSSSPCWCRPWDLHCLPGNKHSVTSHLILEFIWPDSCQCPPLGILHRTFPGWVYPGRTPGSPCTSWSPVWAQWRPEVSWSSRHWPDQCCPSLRSCTPSLQTDWSTQLPDSHHVGALLTWLPSYIERSYA